MNKESKIYVAGHTGLVGSALVKKLKGKGYTRIITKSHRDLDLTRQSETEKFFKEERPSYVLCAAARVGGIGANSTYPAEFIYANLAIALNIIHGSFRYGVKKLLNLGSSCIFPKFAPQPLKEEYLLTGTLEPTNEAYSIAKIAAIKLCAFYNKQYKTDFISVMPTNLYGPRDNYDLNNSHVLAALIRKFHEAAVSDTPVVLWGDGSPYREFLYSDDLADAVIFLMEHYSSRDIGEFINIGTGVEIRIKDLAEKISHIAGYKGNITWDTTKPNGTPRKLLDVSRLEALGWQAKTTLDEGLVLTYEDFKENYMKYTVSV
jgi:GDP-L-fucose synthase